MDTNHAPYGDEWEAEMLQYPPEQIVKMCARALREKQAEIDKHKGFIECMRAIMSGRSKSHMGNK